MSTESSINIQPYKETIVKFLQNRLRPVAVYLYGSITGTRFNNESDIDIAVIAENIDSLTLHELAMELSVLVKRDIHLTDFRTATDILRMEILKQRCVIYCSDDEKRLFHEMIALSSYTKLNEEREVVIKTKYGRTPWMSL